MELETTLNETSTSFELSLNAKGFVQWVIKTKYPTTEKSNEELSKAIDLLKSILKQKGLQEAGTKEGL